MVVEHSYEKFFLTFTDSLHFIWFQCITSSLGIHSSHPEVVARVLFHFVSSEGSTGPGGFSQSHPVILAYLLSLNNVALHWFAPIILRRLPLNGGYVCRAFYNFDGSCRWLWLVWKDEHRENASWLQTQTCSWVWSRHCLLLTSWDTQFLMECMHTCRMRAGHLNCLFRTSTLLTFDKGDRGKTQPLLHGLIVLISSAPVQLAYKEEHHFRSSKRAQTFMVGLNLALIIYFRFDCCTLSHLPQSPFKTQLLRLCKTKLDLCHLVLKGKKHVSNLCLYTDLVENYSLVHLGIPSSSK